MARTTLSQVSAVLTERVRRDLKAAAGANGVLSKAEQASAPAYVKTIADEFRKANPKARVTVGSMETLITKKALNLIGEVNQPRGSGAASLTQAEAKAVAKRDATLGYTVLEAWQVVAGKGLDVDDVAKKLVRDGMDSETTFKMFTTEAEAERYQDPKGRQVRWLVRTGSDLLKNTYVSGRNDLWNQRFEIDKLSGAVTITGEH
jgi:hypothetical protein